MACGRGALRPVRKRASAEFPLSLEGERTPRTRRERVLESARKRRRLGASPVSLVPRRRVIPAKAGAYLMKNLSRGQGAPPGIRRFAPLNSRRRPLRVWAIGVQ